VTASEMTTLLAAAVLVGLAAFSVDLEIQIASMEEARDTKVQRAKKHALEQDRAGATFVNTGTCLAMTRDIFERGRRGDFVTAGQREFFTLLIGCRDLVRKEERAR